MTMADERENGTTSRSEAADEDAEDRRPRRRSARSDDDADRADGARREKSSSSSGERREPRSKARPSRRDDGEPRSSGADDEDDDRSADRAERARGRRPRRSPARIIAAAKQQIEALTGRPVTGVIGFDRTDDGWEVRLEVLELKRVPDTMSILGLVSAELDDDGELVGYRRLKRYAVSQTDEG